MNRICTSIGQQKKIAIEMWQFIKSQIEQGTSMYSITYTKRDWLRYNYPEIEWKNYCLLCDTYLHKRDLQFECPECPLSKKYKGQVKYGCSFDNSITPWSKIVDWEYKKEEAIKACDEIIEAIKEIQGGEEFS